jgi:hypothetical protein
MLRPRWQNVFLVERMDDKQHTAIIVLPRGMNYVRRREIT